MNDNEYININSFIKNYDELNTDFDFSNNDLYYNDFISNYNELTELN